MAALTNNKLIETVRDLESGMESIRRRPYGMIESAHGRFVKIQLRPWPKIASRLEALWLQSMKSKQRQRDVCRLYYNQPLGHRNYLTLSYIESSLNTSVKTIYAALAILEKVAFIKQSDAILAEVANQRISDRFMIRRGWERHRESSRQRHWIKRFYGNFPESAKSFARAASPSVEV